MTRALYLASKGRTTVAPNPMVGAVIVHDDIIIGEGFHEKYGQAHAEVNAIQSVKNKSLLPHSTIYVTLEPCVHYGKTPPCVDLILEHKIPRVVIGSLDPFPQVSGKGAQKLKDHHVEVTTGVMEEACKELNKRFNTFHTKKRPYIILKWAQTADHFMGPEEQKAGERMIISGEDTQVMVHQWRAEEQGILVGAHTVNKDRPRLNVRLTEGKNPRIFVLGNPDKINATALQNLQNPIFIYGNNPLEQLTQHCIEEGILSVMIEGGPLTLHYFIEHGFWDEARIITNTTYFSHQGISSPRITGDVIQEFSIGNDHIKLLKNNHLYV